LAHHVKKNYCIPTFGPSCKEKHNYFVTTFGPPCKEKKLLYTYFWSTM